MIEIEVCIDSVHGAKTAIEGGVRRLEVCSSLGDGGLTPSIGLVKLIDSWGTTINGIKQFIMIRPRAGDFAYSSEEVQVMLDDIRSIKSLNLPTVAGFVFGILNNDRTLNVSVNEALIEAASPKQCTLHRAIDVASDYLKAAEIASQIGFNCILSSGGHQKAIEGLGPLKQLSSRGISVMAGSGVNPSNVVEIITATGVKKVHFSAKTRVPSKYKTISMGSSDTGDGYDSVGIEKVRQMICAVSKL
eukprot:TRINITY_DN22250_c0_g1_i1.p1 TRINITY_DN22250_c0_g1~~TRINITY_DN22250_c0_g1_i1.p1  ORF type:complete len:246 (+),score=49.46 TRINITY_DN22250_c0_g1_i1:53-790(+)